MQIELFYTIRLQTFRFWWFYSLATGSCPFQPTFYIILSESSSPCLTLASTNALLCCFSFGLLLSPSRPHSCNAPRVFLNNRFLPSSARAQRWTLFLASQTCFHVARWAPVAVDAVPLTSRAVEPVCSDQGQQALGSHSVPLGSGLFSLRILHNATVVSLSSYRQSSSRVPQDILAQHLPSSPWSHHPQPDGPLTSLSPSSPP